MDQRSEKSGAVKPILFNTDMVWAILEGVKTETRRLVKPIPPENARLELIGDRRHAMDLSIEIPGPNDRRIYTPPYLPGDILYVRETFMQKETVDRKPTFLYRANPAFENVFFGSPWRPSIHMPKEAARIFLRVTDLRVEHLLDMDEDGARAEGIGEFFIGMGESGFATGPHSSSFWETAVGAFADLWSRTVKSADRERYGWAANPWVWVISFERCQKPEE